MKIALIHLIISMFLFVLSVPRAWGEECLSPQLSLQELKQLFSVGYPLEWKLLGVPVHFDPEDRYIYLGNFREGKEGIILPVDTFGWNSRSTHAYETATGETVFSVNEGYSVLIDPLKYPRAWLETEWLSSCCGITVAARKGTQLFYGIFHMPHNLKRPLDFLENDLLWVSREMERNDFQISGLFVNYRTDVFQWFSQTRNPRGLDRLEKLIAVAYPSVTFHRRGRQESASHLLYNVNQQQVYTVNALDLSLSGKYNFPRNYPGLGSSV